jgi:hypothetical protein
MEGIRLLFLFTLQESTYVQQIYLLPIIFHNRFTISRYIICVEVKAKLMKNNEACSP